MKRKINVIDLDKTLIPYDSFRILVKKEVFNFNLSVIWNTLFRLLRLISLERYKEKIFPLIEEKYDESFFKNFALSLYKDLDTDVLKEIQEETDKNTVNILLSASPNFYVQHLVKKLNWLGAGSYFNKTGKFIHLHGKGKIFWVESNFNINEYSYNLAISDSSSDDNLLNLFQKKIKWILP